MSSMKRGTGYVFVPAGRPHWYARFYAKGQRYLLNTQVRADEPKAKAEAVLIKKWRDAQAPGYVEPSAKRTKFEDLADLLRQAAALDGLRTAGRLGTPEQPRGALHHLTAHFGGWQALAITSQEVHKYADARRKAGARPGTVNRELALLRRAFKLATGGEPLGVTLLPAAPSIGLLNESDNVREGFIEPADFDALLTELRARDALAADVVECLFFSCLRKGNVLGMTWTQVVPEVDGGGMLVGGELRLPGTVMKNKKPLMLPLTGRLLDVLARRWGERVLNCPHVFHRAGRPITRFWGPWRAACAAIGQPHLTPHDLRRSGARTLIRAGVPEDIVMKLGGWKTRAMLSRYNIVDSSDLALAQQKMNQAFATAAPRKVVPLRRVES